MNILNINTNKLDTYHTFIYERLFIMILVTKLSNHMSYLDRVNVKDTLEVNYKITL